MTIVLVRHGETALNAARTVQPFDTPLSSRGAEQAARVARRIAGSFAPAVILSSDAPRALETAAPLARALGRTVIAEPLLRERDFGDLRGRPYDSLGFDPVRMREAPPGGESIEAFEARVRRAWASVNRSQDQAVAGDVIVFTHGLWIRSALEQLAPDLADQTASLVLANTCVTVIHSGPPIGLSLAACTAHLDPGDWPQGIAGI